jgi:hypothetical protein
MGLTDDKHVQKYHMIKTSFRLFILLQYWGKQIHVVGERSQWADVCQAKR